MCKICFKLANLEQFLPTNYRERHHVMQLTSQGPNTAKLGVSFEGKTEGKTVFFENIIFPLLAHVLAPNVAQRVSKMALEDPKMAPRGSKMAS